jgi:drug/metabolite transporter (DMT)-like permease
VNSRSLAALALTFNALVFGVSWWPLRTLQGHGLHPLWATAFIFLFSSACILVLRPGGWRAFAAQPLLCLLFVSSGLTNVGFNWAVTVGDVVRVVLLFYLMPAWSVLLAWPLLGEKPSVGSLLRLGLALAGVVIVLKKPDSPWPLPAQLADWLALMGGFFFALTNILLKKLANTPEASRMFAMFGGGAVMAIAAAGLGMNVGLVALPPAPAPDWLWVALGLSLAFLLGNLALQYGAARLSASATALIMLTEVVFASASASWLGAGEITLRTLLGAGLILLASLLSVAGPGKSPP